MAVPMRSTDFRSIVEPILNESFDGIYNQRADEWKGCFVERNGTPLTKSPFSTVSMLRLRCLMALR
jgi:hypothetical protein